MTRHEKDLRQDLRRGARRSAGVLLTTAVLALPGARAAAQIPDVPKNLQVLPKDISRDSLVQIMRRFSLDLGVRCQYCHVGGDGVSFEGVVFESDEDPDKVKARAMLQMVRYANDFVLAGLPDRDTPAVEVTCKTCHRGRSRPVLLAQELRMALDDFGPDSAVARYERFRSDDMTRGWFDFGEWEVNLLGERLQAEGRFTDAIAIYQLNGRYYPESPSIAFSLGALYEQTGDVEAAVRSYERVLELAPENRRALRRLEALRGGTPPDRDAPRSR